MITQLTTIRSVIEARQKNKHNNLKIGFVPTMGALHAGHISLIRACKKNNEICFSSIYVNPTQFNEIEDYNNYPKTINADLEMLADAGCDYVFLPETKEIYPAGTEHKIHVDLGGLDTLLEGKFRTGHFDGVVTIVKKFFEIVQPDSAYFGQKDFQQYLVIKKMIEILDFKIDIHLCPIIRESDGLAMSSRNQRLNTQERRLAPIIYETLTEAAILLQTNEPEYVKNWAKKNLSHYPLISFEYFEILDASNLSAISVLKNANNVIICVAVKIGNIRLIDNILL